MYGPYIYRINMNKQYPLKSHSPQNSPVKTAQQGSAVTAVAWNPQHLLLSVAAEEVEVPQLFFFIVGDFTKKNLER